MLGSWLTAKPKANAPTQSLGPPAEPLDLEDALQAVIHIMNDDVESAEAGLNNGHSSFHKLGRGVITFMEAALGFEPEFMREASARLGDAENSAWHDQRNALRDPTSYRSAIYPPGSEYALCNAEAQLMSAVVGVLNESLTESIKAFYKLRKAYITLHTIVEAENTYMRGMGYSDVSERHSLELVVAQASETTEAPIDPGIESKASADKPTGTDEADENKPPLVVNATAVKLDLLEENLETLSLKSAANSTNAPISRPLTPASNVTPIEGDITAKVSEHPTDAFIHSGISLCFGLLLLIISMIPPAFGRLLYVIGVGGDREKGLKMLWRATRFENINGAMAGFILLGYYNGLAGFSDILLDREDDGVVGYPKQRCQELLMQMRSRYPKSQLWHLETARMEAANYRLETALEMLSEGKESQMKQVTALVMFERSLDSMYLHRYGDTADFFMKCVELNNWSHALYYYIAGSAHIELYRKLKSSDPEQAEKHAEKAEEVLRKAPTLSGKRRFLARQLPLDVFVARKVQKWQHRATEWDVRFVDAVGVSPIEEMIYMWNGYKRMDPSKLQDSLAALAWSTDSNEHWSRESLDERAINAVLRATILRSLGRFGEAREILKTEILSHDRAAFKGHLKDDWTCPSAHYEMAVICWKERESRGEGALAECKEWLDKAAKWESYELDARWVPR
ncbi:MAG: Tetratricopeptide repeat protein 39C [Geoglossum umbratile]|nr:MAG: Tetratricopeptide repeat protein 39C [Geoglossum umbratile]